jgi:hypothetical protein
MHLLSNTTCDHISLADICVISHNWSGQLVVKYNCNAFLSLSHNWQKWLLSLWRFVSQNHIGHHYLSDNSCYMYSTSAKHNSSSWLSIWVYQRLLGNLLLHNIKQFANLSASFWHLDNKLLGGACENGTTSLGDQGVVFQINSLQHSFSPRSLSSSISLLYFIILCIYHIDLSDSHRAECCWYHQRNPVFTVSNSTSLISPQASRLLSSKYPSWPLPVVQQYSDWDYNTQKHHQLSRLVLSIPVATSCWST